MSTKRPNDLERRRLAIVRALHLTAAEPPAADLSGPTVSADEPPHAERLTRLEREVGEVRRELRDLSDRVVPDLSDGRIALDDRDRGFTGPPVPAVDLQVGMSDQPAKALFGY